MSGNEQEYHGRILVGSAPAVLTCMPDALFDLSIWSPPYLMNRSYEQDLDKDGWDELMRAVLVEHTRVMRPGRFVAVNIADSRSWPDEDRGFQPRMANPSRRNQVSGADVEAARRANPTASRRELGRLLGCSEQTIARREKGNNHRAARRPATRLLMSSRRLTWLAEEAGLQVYDHRVWHKSPSWSSCHWHTTSYRAIDEFEHIFVFRTPGPGVYDRRRLSTEEWAHWGSRGVWVIPSVKSHRRHEAEFPEEIPRRLIRLLSKPGDWVLDPFVGSGTTTAVARQLDRLWTGIERDPDNAELARTRTGHPSYRGRNEPEETGQVH